MGSLRSPIKHGWHYPTKQSDSHPKRTSKHYMQILHAAHQGTSAMSARANQNVYWPEMNTAIGNHRSICTICNEIAPRQSAEPLILTPETEWPFQKICADYFEHEGHTYL